MALCATMSVHVVYTQKAGIAMVRSVNRWLGAALMVIALGVALAILPGAAHAASTGKAATGLVAAQAAESELTVGEADVQNVTVKARARVQDAGWKPWVASGKTAGTTTSKGLRTIRLKLENLGSLGGSINYRVYDMGKGWRPAVANGKSAGNKARAIQRFRIWLSGDVSSHYDVLYRGYIKGKGWQAWIKNKAIASAKSGYFSAIQVKLSPKSRIAAGTQATAPGVRYEARMKRTGWLAWTGDGKTSGKARKNQTMDGFVLSLESAGIQGGVQYRAYVQGKRWSQGWKAGGKVVGASGKRIEALQFKLTGEIANSYDIYYRSYVYGYGWLDWTCNGSTTGSTGLSLPIAAVQVKLVAKGTAVSGIGAETTVNAKRNTLNGIDISSWQSGINIAKVSADFVIVKATGGVSYTNPYFRSMADSTLSDGKLLGLYHFAREYGVKNSATSEADHFVNAAIPYIGKAVLVLDWEASALNLGPTWAKKFLDRVYKRTGVRPLIYMSKNPTREYNWSAVANAGYKLWVAQYASMGSTGYQSNPWTDSYGFGAWDKPTIFQYSSNGRISGFGGALDLNVFYGKTSDWQALAAKQK